MEDHMAETIITQLECNVDGCGYRGTLTRGYCRKHYRAMMRSGELQKTSTQDLLKKQENLFKSRCIKRESGCIEFIGKRYNNSEHGRTQNGNVTMAAHRYAWELVNGPIPDGIYILHKCDNLICINLDHLYTVNDSVDDVSIVKQAWNLDEKYGRSKLSVTSVMEILDRLGRGEKGYEIAKSHNISAIMVSMIKLGECWEHIRCDVCGSRFNLSVRYIDGNNRNEEKNNIGFKCRDCIDPLAEFKSKPKCKIKGCDRQSEMSGLCWMHKCNDQSIKYERTCDVDGCNRKHKARGYCRLHYSRLRTEEKIRNANA